MFARTPRLTLRPGWPEDAPALAAAIGHRPVASRLAGVPWPYREEDAAAFLTTPRGAHDPRFLIWDHQGASPRLIGGIGLSPQGDAMRLGYWLTPDAWGRGYATEAGRVVVEMARHALPVRRLVATHQAGNAASGRVLHKLGFRPTGRGRHDSRADAAVEHCEYGLDLDGDAQRCAMPMAA